MSQLAARAMIAVIALGLAAADALAQTDYPRRSITLIVPFAAGGPTDVVARIIGRPMPPGSTWRMPASPRSRSPAACC